MAGFGHITEAREVTQGEIRDGGGSIAVGGGAGGVPNLMNAHLDPFRARMKRLENLKPIALGCKLAREKAVDEAEQMIRDHELQSRTEGYRDANGVICPGFETLSGEQAEGVADRWYDHNRKFAEKVWTDKKLDGQQIDALKKRLHPDMTRRHAALSKWSAGQVAGANVEKADVYFKKNVERANAEILSSAKAEGETVGAMKALGTDDANATRIGAGLVAENIEHYVGSLERMRDEYVEKLVTCGLGLMSADRAKEKADAEIRKASQSALVSLAQSGQYDRARKLAQHGKRFGFTDADIAKGREMVDGCEMNAAVNEAMVAINAVRDANGNWPAGRVETIDRAIATVQRVGKMQPKGSKIAADAAAAVARMDRHAELIRYAEMADNPASVGLDAADAATAKNPFKKVTRDARCWEAVREAAYKGAKPSAARAEFMKSVEANMRHYANGEKGLSPAQFYADVTAAMKGGAITNADRLTLVDKFEKGWGNGYLGDANKQSVLQRRAQAVSAILKEEFGDAIESELARDKDGIVKLTKDGGFSYDPKAEPSGLEITRQIEGKPSTRIIAPGWSSHTPARRTSTVVLTPDEKLMVANKALELAKYDGMELGFDPVTGLEMEEGKKHKVNVANDMRRLCGLLKSSKAAEGVRDAALERLRGRRPTFGQMLEGVGMAEMATSPLGPLGLLGLAAERYGALADADGEEAGRKSETFKRPTDAFSEFFMRVEEKGKALRN